MVRLRIPDCPKKMNSCVKQLCPMWRCYAYDKYEQQLAREKKADDRGWE